MREVAQEPWLYLARIDALLEDEVAEVFLPRCTRAIRVENYTKLMKHLLKTVAEIPFF